MTSCASWVCQRRSGIPRERNPRGLPPAGRKINDKLVARVQAVIRRSKSTSTTKDYIKIDTLTIDLYKHEVTVKNESIPLTLTEFKLLHQLASKPGRVFTRDQLLDAVSGSETFVIDRTVDVHIASLRKKLKAYANRIITIRGIGYKFQE